MLKITKGSSGPWFHFVRVIWEGVSHGQKPEVESNILRGHRCFCHPSSGAQCDVSIALLVE